MQPARTETWGPLSADDATIEAALAEAHVPALMCALVHLTGDVSILRGSIKPDASFFGDQQCGISEADQATIRARALEALKAYRDGDGTLPPQPDSATVHEMINFITGQQVDDRYVEFLEHELALRGEDAYAQPLLDGVPEDAKQGFKVLVVGAGMSGLLAAIRLEEAGIPWQIVEKNPDVGGTWLENTYPGCRVDSPNHTYSYSFEPNDWPQHFSPQATLLGYFDRVATGYDLRDGIRFDTEVKRMAWDEEAGLWHVTVQAADGTTEVLDANAVISAVGQLNRPKLPDIDGLDDFAGVSFHSARWEHEHDLAGKRVGVIGTGASAFQFVPEVAKEAGQVTVFQRTAPWQSPTPEYHDDVPEGKHWLLRHVPFYGKWFRFWMFWVTSEGILSMVTVDPDFEQQPDAVSEANDGLRLLLTEWLRELSGGDNELFEKSVPDYPPGAKRMLRDNGNWMRALARDNVEVVTEPIARVTPNGVQTQDGTEHACDVLIHGTGFHASKFLWPMEVVGRGGKDLRADWGDDPRAYLGITVPDFPNLFCLYGPNTNIVVNGSIIFFSECEVRYVLGCLALLMGSHPDGGQHQALSVRRDVHDAYNDEIDAGNRQMAWGVSTVNTWYKNSAGRITQNWPFTLRDYWQRTRVPDPQDYEFS